MSKLEPQNFFQKIEKTNDDVIFSGLKAKLKTGPGLGLGKILQSLSLVSDESISTTALIEIAIQLMFYTIFKAKLNLYSTH